MRFLHWPLPLFLRENGAAGDQRRQAQLFEKSNIHFSLPLFAHFIKIDPLHQGLQPMPGLPSGRIIDDPIPDRMIT